MSNLFNEVLEQVPEDIKSFVDNSFDIVNQIHSILESQGKSQKDLANMLGKRESEISKWMRGTHNFTLRSISKIEDALGVKIITTVEKAKPEFITKMIPVNVHSSINNTKKVSNVWDCTGKFSPLNHGLKTA